MSTITCPNTNCGHVVESNGDLKHCPKCGGFLPMPDVADAADPLIGQPILNGKYRILSIIGEGGMGKVYLAEQKLGTAVRKVAIKTLQPDLAQDPQIIARFHRETQTVIELEHPNTIKFYDFGELEDHGKKLFVVMEYIQGESLAHLLARGPIEVPRAERIMAQICGSLQEAHDRGIVHRDLKPENIFLTQKGARGDFVKVLDFGIAKRDNAESEKEAKLTRQGMVLGTPPYMSPEQFTGLALDARSDIYALGVMAYEMLTGQLPFTAQTPWEWATKHLTAQPTPFETQVNGDRVPDRHRKAIMHSLAKKREERPASVTQFLQEFSGNADGATDWTAGSTSLTNAGNTPPPHKPASIPPAAMAPTGMQQAIPSNPGFAPTGVHPANTPNPFMQPSQGGFVPAPSNAGFAGVPPMTPPSNPGFHPGGPMGTGPYAPMTGPGMIPSMQHIPGAGMPGSATQRGRTGMVVGLVLLGLGILGGGGWAVNEFVLNADDPQTAAAGPQQGQQQPQQQQQTPQMPQPTMPQMPQQAIAPTFPTPTLPTTPFVPAPALPSAPTQAALAPTAPVAPTVDRASSAVTRGVSLAQAGNVPGAISALQEATRANPASPGLARLRNEIRHSGRRQIDQAIITGHCSAAQGLYRQLNSAGVNPGADSFGPACRAPR